jgi:3-oxoacyl-[acyl-carrier-protein] synthase III
MKEYSAGILGIGAYLPKKIVTNNDLTQLVDTSDAWIVERTGIKQRHIAESSSVTSDLAAGAAKQALVDSGISAEDVDLILVATITPDSLMPSTASQVQKKISAKNAAALDISAACSGFVYGLTIAQQFVLSGSMKHILVIGAEILTRSLDWNDRSICVLFGDGAGAAVVGRVPNDKGIIAYNLGADGTAPAEWLSLIGSGTSGRHDMVLTDSFHRMRMHGKAIYKFGVDILPATIKTVLQKSQMSIEDIDLIIPHQANKRIIVSAAEHLGVPMSKFYINIDRRANTSGASIPIAMADARNDGVLKKGDTILLAGFGGGLTWGSMVLKY